MDRHSAALDIEARRAVVLHDRPLVVDLITLTLNHGVFAVRAASTLAELKAILEDWVPNISGVDVNHDDSTAVLKLLGALEQVRADDQSHGRTRRIDVKKGGPLTERPLLARTRTFAGSPARRRLPR
jgi:hypothetical protein